MEEVYIGLIILGSLAVPTLKLAMNNEESYTRNLTGVNPAKFYYSINLSRALEEFQKKAKEMWDKQPRDAKNLGDILYEFHMYNQMGNLSSELEKTIEFERRQDSDFLSKQVNTSLQKEINAHIADKLQSNTGASEIAKGLEVSNQDVRDWISKYNLDTPSSLNDPRYFYYNDDLRFEKGYSVSNSKGRSDRWTSPQSISASSKSNNQQFGGRSIGSAGEVSNEMNKTGDDTNQSHRQLDKDNNLKRNNVSVPRSFRRGSAKNGSDRPRKNLHTGIGNPVNRGSDFGYPSLAGGNSPHQYSRGSNVVGPSVQRPRKDIPKLKKRVLQNHKLLTSQSIWSRIKRKFQNKPGENFVKIRKFKAERANPKIDVTEPKNQNQKAIVRQEDNDVINQIIEYIIEGKSVNWISKVTGVPVAFIRDLKRKMASSKIQKPRPQKERSGDVKKQQNRNISETIRKFHGLKEIPICCDLPSNSSINDKLQQLPIELKDEMTELMEYGFQPFAIKDWMTKDILGRF